MHVKTFEALSLKDALKKIKTELGNDAVIISTKTKVLPQDPQSKVIEVTAAIPEHKILSGASAYSGAEHLSASRHQQLDNLQQTLNVMADKAITREQLNLVENGIQELKMLLIENLTQRFDSVLKGLPKTLVSIFQQLKLTGLHDSHIQALLKHLKSLPAPEGKENQTIESQEEYYRSHAIRWMLRKIKIMPKWNAISGSTSIHAFIGSTGSGKTSVVAKLAALCHLKEKANVLVISFDTLRLAATDQLRIYSKVIGVPFEVASTPEELKSILSKSQKAEIIFIDTSGRSPKNQELIKTLKVLNEYNLPIDKHLVLSITEKETQLDQTIRSFSPVGIQSLIFAKLDEAWSYGEIYNLSAKWSLPLSYFSIGQSVPDDIERATRERVIERIFNL